MVVGPVVSDVRFQITFFTSWHLMSYQARSNQRKLHRNSTSWQWSFYSMTLKWGLSVSAPQYLLLVWVNVLCIRQEIYTLIYIYLCKKWAFRSSIWLIWSKNIQNVQLKSYLIFVTDTTDGVCVKKLPGVNFYRFNAKNWQFTV